jgi:uracil-DNA glycosylase family 4
MGFFKAEQLKGTAPHSSLPACGKCGLYRQCQSPKMPPGGRKKRRIMFLGEAPGATEDRRNTQLVGDAGQCLRKLLDGIVELDDCIKHNSISCRPPSNEMDDLYIDACRPLVNKAIRELKPNVIVLLGASALKSVVGPEWSEILGEMARWVGWHIPSQRHNAWLCPTYHPSYVMRQENDKALWNIVRNQLRAAVRLEDVPVPMFDVEERKKQIDIYEDPRKTEMALKRLIGCIGLCSFDYETECLRPELPWELFSVSFHVMPNEAHEGPFTFSGRLDASCYPALSAVLRNGNLKKIGTNIKFEERWTRRRLGHGVAGWLWDTMLSTHIADNREGITGLKFQTYINLGIGDYAEKIKPFFDSTGSTDKGRNMIRKAPLREVLMYGGLDAIFEYEIGKLQMERASWLK